MIVIRQFRPNLFYRIFKPSASQTYLVLGLHYLISKTSNGTEQVAYEYLEDISSETFLLWKKLRLKTSTGSKLMFGWVSSNTNAAIINALKNQRKTSLRFVQRNHKNLNLIQSLNNWYLSCTSGTRWVTYREIQKILLPNPALLNYLWEMDVDDLPKHKTNLANHIRYMNEVAKDPDRFRTKCNNQFEAQELIRYSKFFDQILGTPLTNDQRKAIIVNEDAQLVVAAAGSGKTTTIKGKAAYLIDKSLAKPHEILIISFNKNVQRDLEEALHGDYPGIAIHTFHGLGLKVISESRGYKPSLTELSESPDKLPQYLDGLIKELYEEDPSLLTEFFISYAKPYRDKFDFQNLGEYIAYVRSVGLMTLNGETVKSMEELELANFLYANGINYKYEEPYKHVVASVQRRQYKPDFYLPEYEIYIEHFALNDKGNTPPFINKQEYLSGRDWKILTHKQYETTLVETFSHEKKAGTLTTGLKKKLCTHGVVFSPRPKNELLDKLNSSGYITELGMLLSTFLNLFKGSQVSLTDLNKRIDSKDVNATRARKFLKIFSIVFQKYEEYLSSKSAIDFNDMIRMAAQELTAGTVFAEFKYLLIDEFQDISIGRAEFIKAFLNASRYLKLMAVGDDWQSVYRFSGSDISVMTSFSNHFGRHEQRMLTETFRFDQMIEAVASRFVLKNHSQISKVVRAKAGSGKKSVILWHPSKDADSLLGSISKMIPPQKLREQTVLVLARYKFYKDELNLSEMNTLRPDLKWKFSTIHSAKGAEADYAVILGVKSGSYSFPSEIADDPLLDLVLSTQDHFEHAEERRLLYVALTRTKNTIFIVGNPSYESPFFKELVEDPDVETCFLGHAFNRRCQLCKAQMVERKSEHGLFFGCSNFPICTGTSRPCISCGIGFLRRQGSNIACDNQPCLKKYEACPTCADGMLVERTSKYGPFFGCTNFAAGKCKYTRKVTLPHAR